MLDLLPVPPPPHRRVHHSTEPDGRDKDGGRPVDHSHGRGHDGTRQQRSIIAVQLLCS